MNFFPLLVAFVLYLELISQRTTGQRFFSISCNKTVITSSSILCYYIINDKSNWFDANTACATNGGGLARISNRKIYNEIHRIVNDKDGTENYWIGLKRDENTKQFEWTDGTNLTYNRGIINNIIQGYDCGGINGNTLLSLNCSNSHYFICEIDVCNGWTVNNGICYKMLEDNINWNEAEVLCEEVSGYLAEIPNIYVNAVINQVIGRKECWIGLSTDNTDYSWRIGNFPLSHPKKIVLPNNDKNKCGTIGVNSSERWDLKDCHSTQSCAVCMKGPLTIDYPTIRCRKANYPKVIVDSGTCYRWMFRRAFELDLASLTCSSYNGELYKFDDSELNGRLTSFFTSLYPSFVFTKLNPNQYDQFVPQDGYFNLLTSDDNLTTPAGCQRLSKNNEYEEIDCDDSTVNFLCKIEYEPFEKVLERVLTDEWCFWSVSGNRNWTEAEIQCTREGGHLIEIFNENTQNIILSLIATDNQYLDELYWIGIGEHVNSSSQWRSGADITFSYFPPNTNLNALDSKCVAIGKNSIWVILDCNYKYSFVCGKNVSGGDNSPCYTQDTTQQTIAYSIQDTTQQTIEYSTQDTTQQTIEYSTQDTTQQTIAYSTQDTTQQTIAYSTQDTTQQTIAYSTQDTTQQTIAYSTQDTTTQYTSTTQVNTTTQNNGTIRCNTELESSICGFIAEALNENGTDTSSILGRERLLETLSNQLNITTGSKFEYMSPELDLIVIGVNQSQNTDVNIGSTKLLIESSAFAADATIAITSFNLKSSSDNTDGDILKPKDSRKIVSDIITMVSSGLLRGKLTIVFKINASNYDGLLTGNSLTPKREWNNSGIKTVIKDGTIDCIITRLSTIALLVTYSTLNSTENDPVGRAMLIIISYILLTISLLFLLISMVIFIISGKRFFSRDINILHFNHTLTLLLALGCFIFLVQSASKVRNLCMVIAFLLHFLWTNVFMSSFSIAILVFYSIWVVGIKHEARNLSPLLIPIGWCVSLIWAAACLIYGITINGYIDSKYEGDEYFCFLSTKNNLIWWFLVPIYVILLVNTSVLVLCLYKIRLVLKSKNRSEKEFSILFKVSIGGILLVPALGLPFIFALPLSFSQFNPSYTLHTVFEWAYILSNAPIGLVHFILITYQIPEARIPRYCRSNKSQLHTTSVTDSIIARDNPNRIRSLHFNLKRPSDQFENTTVYGNDWVETRL